MLTLGDPHPADLALTAGYCLAVGSTLYAATRRRLTTGQIVSWLVIAALLAALVVNQQLDLHVRLLHGGKRSLVAIGLPPDGTLIAAACGIVLISLAALASWAILVSFRRGYPPGAVAGAGLVLLAIHDLGRGARLLHVFRGAWADDTLTTALKGVLAVGLVLVIVGTLRWRPGRQPVILNEVESEHVSQTESELH